MQANIPNKNNMLVFFSIIRFKRGKVEKLAINNLFRLAEYLLRVSRFVKQIILYWQAFFERFRPIRIHFALSPFDNISKNQKWFIY